MKIENCHALLGHAGTHVIAWPKNDTQFAVCIAQNMCGVETTRVSLTKWFEFEFFHAKCKANAFGLNYDTRNGSKPK